MNLKYCFISLLLLAFVVLVFSNCTQSSKPYDIVIKSGGIVDGTGNPVFQGDIGIKGDRIIKIGNIPEGEGKKIIDANGLYVAPGFIDIHTHVDRQIASQPTVKNYLLQGVTTVVGGNCGGSEFPLQELISQLEKSGIAINFASLIGHNTIRQEIMGRDGRAPTAEELSKMKDLVRQEMLAGAIGLSTGLAYIPGRYSITEEIVELAKMIQPFNGVYTTHMRNQGLHIKEAIEESILIGKEAGVPVQISHIKLANDAVWGDYKLITGPIEQARKQGQEVYMDQYPYTATSSGFTSSFPGWAVAGGNEAYVERLQDPDNYQKIRLAIIKRRLSSTKGIDKLKTIYVSRNDNHPEYQGKNLAEILQMLGRKPTVNNGADLIMEMEKLDRPRAVFFQMAEEDVSTLMQKSYNIIASDGKIEIPGVEVPHPRAYGTFPRVLAKYVREQGVLTLPGAISKMTSLPALAMGFNERGVLKPNMYADIVVFNAEEIQDTATFENPHRYPEGIRWIFVNGKIAAQDGRVVEEKSGKILFGSGREDT